MWSSTAAGNEPPQNYVAFLYYYALIFAYCNTIKQNPTAKDLHNITIHRVLIFVSSIMFVCGILYVYVGVGPTEGERTRDEKEDQGREKRVKCHTKEGDVAQRREEQLKR